MTMHFSGLGQGLTADAFPGGSSQTGSRTASVMFTQAAPTAALSPTTAWPSSAPSANPYLSTDARQPAAAPGPGGSATIGPAIPTLPAIPGCLDATWQTSLKYCESYPLSNGPDAAGNTLCAVARSQPAWYNQVKATPACAAPLPEVPPVKEEPSVASKPNYMLWGGLALLVVAAGGGLYYASRGKKYTANPKRSSAKRSSAERSSAGVRKLIRQLDAAAKEPDPDPKEINALLRKIRDKTK